METEIKNKYHKDIFQYLNYIKSLTSPEYITNFVKSNIETDRISEKNLLSIISQIKDSEPEIKNKEDIEIIENDLLPNSYLKRITLIEEYYKDGKPFNEKNVEYQLEGV